MSLQKICDLRGWPAGSDKNAETHEVMFKIWEGLRSKADKDNDGQVGSKWKLDNISKIDKKFCKIMFLGSEKAWKVVG